MPVRLIYWLQCLLCEQSALSRAVIATDAESEGKPANNRRDNVPRTQERARALSHAGAIV
jgi:hypothetical protein